MEELLETSYCVILGMTGHGKSTFINAISNSNNCRVSNKGKSQTKYINSIQLKKNNHSFIFFDTPGLGDSKDNEEVINRIKEIISHYPYIKKIIIIKPYSELRLSEYLQNALKVMMDSFPLKDFWDHVIIVNNRCVPTDIAYQDFLEENPENFLDKLKNCNNLKSYMKDKNINFPSKLKEFFIDSKRKNQYPEIKAEFEKILKNIKESKMMFKSITKEPHVTYEKNGVIEGTKIIIDYDPIKCKDFKDNISIIKTNYKETMKIIELKPILLSTQRIEKYRGERSVQWFDVISFGISWAARRTSIYDIYERKIYLNQRTREKTTSEYYIRTEYR